MKVINEQIRSIQPDTPIISLKEIKNYLKIDHNEDDKLLLTLVKSAQQVVESILNKKILKTKLKYKASIVFTPNELADISEYSNRYKLIKIKIPLEATTSTESLYIGSSKAASDCFSVILNEPDGQKLVIQKQAFIGHIENQEASISLAMTAGLFDSVDDISANIKLAIMMQTAELYDNRNYTYMRTKSVRRTLRQMLSAYIHYTNI